MNKILLTLLALIVISTYTSCKLDTPDFGGATAVSSSNTYQPVTKGSYWKYKATAFGVNTDNTITMTGATSTIASRKFYNAASVSSLGSSPGYFYVNGHTYSIRSTSYVQGITVEFTWLKDDAAVGATWVAAVSDDGKVNDVPAQMMGTIMEKGITKAVNGKTYTNVIHTQVELQYDFLIGTGFETMGLYDFYFAKGIGMILTESSIMGIPAGTTELAEYSIK